MQGITAFVDLSHLAPEDVAREIAAHARADRLGGIVSRVIVHLNSASDVNMVRFELELFLRNGIESLIILRKTS